MLDKFIELLENEVKNKSIYVWGGNGESYPIVNEDWIERHETNITNAKRAIKLYKKAVVAGYEKQLKAFDCSGLGYYCLKQLGLQKTDINANGFKGKCEKIKKEQLTKGCFVFKVNASGRAYHIGYVVDDNLNVIEAKGRDDGVIKRPLKSGGWNYYGIPSYFNDEINTTVAKETYIFKRLLKKKTPLIKGEDVKILQAKLNDLGFNCGKVDGAYGNKTATAVKAYQKANNLTVDGKAGKNTITKLGFKWEG